ncbi:hemagglutinin repeat-containing protein [Herbaspirillum robiniae]|uniref:hemagglutinin repeat-containing protein n=1 Tax=Herbaspirillum robiniae TaxID=2014887 RepID=UPI003D77749D
MAALYVANPNATLVASAGRDINLNAAQIANSGAGGTTTLAASRNINIGTVAEKSTQALSWDANNNRKEALTNEVGSSIAANGNVCLLAGNDINARGANISSDKGAIELSAANNVNISTASATQHVEENHQTTGSSGMFSKKTVTTHDLLDQSQALGSTLSGNTVTVMAGNDLGVTGSNVVSTSATRLGANNNVTITAASDNADSTHVRNEVTSGLFSGGSFGVTIGTQELDNKNRTISKTAVSSTVGSTDGNVSIVAGNAYAQTGSSVLAPKGDIDITAKKVDILAAIDSERNTQDMVFTQSGLTLQITSPIISAIQTVQQMKKAAESTSDSRMQLLAAANVGFAGKNAVDAIKAGQGQTIDGKANQIATGETGPDGKPVTRDSNDADKAGGINLAISIGASKNESHSESNANTARSSTVFAGGNVNIAAQGDGVNSNIVVQGSDIKAGVNATLKADNEVKLLAAQNTTEQHSNNKGISGSVGISIGTDGLMFNAGLSGSRGRGDGNDVTQVNTHVDAGNKLSISSGTDTTLAGAVASGKQVVMNVGTSGSGNLNIASLQDTSTYKSKQESLGVSMSVGMGKMSGSLNASRSTVDGNYASVNEQSGINAGDGGFQINVAGNTDLKGGKIASTDKAAANGKNSLTTQTLTQSDIKNRSDYKAESQSIGIGAGYGGSKLSMNGTGVGIGSSSGSASSTTRSGISQGDIKITDSSAQQSKTGLTAEQTLAGINTDVSSERDTSGKITKTWNGQQLQNEVQAQAQITQMFGREAAKAIGTYATEQVNELNRKIKKASPEEKAALIAERDKWEEGGLYRTALHTAAGALGGGIDGALGAATSSMAMPQIGKLIDGLDLPQAVKQGLAQVTATALGGIVGGTSGLAAGVNVEANNRQLHVTEKELLKKNAARFAKQLFDTGNPTEQQVTTALALLVNTAQNLIDYNFGYDVPYSKKADAFIRVLQSEYAAISPNLSIGNGQYLFYATSDQMNSPYINSGSIDKEIAGLIIKAPIKQSGAGSSNSEKRDPLTNLPLDSKGRYSQQIVVDGTAYNPKYFPCATPDCLGKNLDLSDQNTAAYVKAIDKKIFDDLGRGSTVATIASPVGAAGVAASIVGSISAVTSGYLNDSTGTALAGIAIQQVAQQYLQRIYGVGEATAARIVALVDLTGGWSEFIDRTQKKLKE